MSYVTLEDVLEELKAALIKELPKKLAAISTEYNDGIPLPEPASSAYFICNNTTTIPVVDSFPAVILLGYAETTQTSGEQEWDVWELSCAVRFFYEGTSPERLNKAIYRYSRAVVSIVRAKLEKLGEALALRVVYSDVPEAAPLYQAFEASFLVRVVRSYA